MYILTTIPKITFKAPHTLYNRSNIKVILSTSIKHGTDDEKNNFVFSYQASCNNKDFPYNVNISFTNTKKDTV